MKKNTLIAVFTFLTLFILIYTVEAVDCTGFGSIPHTTEDITVKPDSSTYLGISFFNCKDEDLIVEIEVDNLPTGWWFTIESENKYSSDSIYLKSQEPTKIFSGSGDSATTINS